MAGLSLGVIMIIMLSSLQGVAIDQERTTESSTAVDGRYICTSFLL